MLINEEFEQSYQLLTVEKGGMFGCIRKSDGEQFQLARQIIVAEDLTYFLYEITLRVMY